jgi:DMSO/TMAO reductase YedYZ heme-binding membrane subunit
MNAQLWWYLARASGIVAWTLVSASVVWGLALSTRILGSNPRPNWMLDLHRFLGGLALTFTGVHLVSLLLDNYVSFSPAQLLVPLTSTYRPGAVAWGIVGFYLLVAVELTSLLRRHLSKRVWRLTHLLSFPLFVLSTVHGLLAGTDGTGRPLFAAMAGASLLVLALTVASFDHHRSKGRRSGPAVAGPARRPRVSAGASQSRGASAPAGSTVTTRPA